MQKCGAGKIDDVTVATLVRNLVEADHDLQISERRNRRPAAGTTTTKLPLSNMKTSGAVETFPVNKMPTPGGSSQVLGLPISKNSKGSSFSLSTNKNWAQ